jgi:hypothetical protein
MLDKYMYETHLCRIQVSAGQLVRIFPHPRLVVHLYGRLGHVCFHVEMLRLWVVLNRREMLAQLFVVLLHLSAVVVDDLDDLYCLLPLPGRDCRLKGLHCPTRLYVMVDCRVELLVVGQVVAPLFFQTDNLRWERSSGQFHSSSKRSGFTVTFQSLTRQTCINET